MMVVLEYATQTFLATNIVERLFLVTGILPRRIGWYVPKL
jgi:hypothetical protein